MQSLEFTIRSASGRGIVLDHRHDPPLTLSPDRFFAVHNQVGALDRLMYGMRFCYNAVKDQESKLRGQGGLVLAAQGLRSFRGDGVEEGIIYSSFDWYAINVCRFVQLRTFISDQLQASDYRDRVDKAKAYRSAVCGPVNTFRDKIAAHFAETDPKLTGEKRDNAADLYTSTLLTVGFADGRLRAGAVLGVVAVGEDTIEAQHDIRWSLTEFHDRVLMPSVTGKVPD